MNTAKINLPNPIQPGPVKWCVTCSRKHPARACQLITVFRLAKKSKRLVTRMAHPYPLTDTTSEENVQES